MSFERRPVRPGPPDDRGLATTPSQSRPGVPIEGCWNARQDDHARDVLSMSGVWRRMERNQIPPQAAQQMVSIVRRSLDAPSRFSDCPVLVQSRRSGVRIACARTWVNALVHGRLATCAAALAILSSPWVPMSALRRLQCILGSIGLDQLVAVPRLFGPFLNDARHTPNGC